MGFLHYVEMYLYSNRYKSIPWERLGGSGFSISEVLAWIARWFNSTQDDLFLDYHNWIETGRIRLTLLKCKAWQTAYKKYKHWKIERSKEIDEMILD